MNYKQYIEINSEKRFGKPIIKGTRISVADVLNWLANGMSSKEIIQDFPELNEEQINDCLFFAASKEGHLGIASWNCCSIKIFLTESSISFKRSFRTPSRLERKHDQKTNRHPHPCFHFEHIGLWEETIRLANNLSILIHSKTKLAINTENKELIKH